MKKSAFTLVESLVSVLIISAVGMAALVFSSAYLKTTFERDMQMKTVMSNVSTVEKLRAEVKTLPQLYEFSQGKEMKNNTRFPSLYDLFHRYILQKHMPQVLLHRQRTGRVLHLQRQETYCTQKRKGYKYPL